MITQNQNSEVDANFFGEKKLNIVKLEDKEIFLKAGSKIKSKKEDNKLNHGTTVATFKISLNTWYMDYNSRGDCEPVVNKISIQRFFDAKCHKCVHNKKFVNENGYGYFITDNCNEAPDNILEIGRLAGDKLLEKCNFLAKSFHEN